VLVVDANVLIYAANSAARRHSEAREWLERSLAGAGAVGFAWVVLLAFLRLTTHPAILPRPMSADESAAQVEAWLGAPAAVTIEPTARHIHVLRGLLADSGTAGNLITDAHLAALAIEHGADLVSYDRDFARFDGLRHRLPGG
jgi:toxin-antitoxin system PIN domain toxin